MKDKEVIDRIEKGDESALDYLYIKLYSMITRSILKNGGNEEEAKDIFQDALIVFWQKVSKRELTLTAKISTYVYSVSQNLWHKELLRKKRYAGEPADIPFSEDFENKERIKIIRDCIDKMGKSCRDILTAHYFDGLGMTEIAEKFGLANADTAKTRKYKCKKKLDLFVKSHFTSNDFLD
ncbi:MULTISPECIES: RNA polymerase sigma factor [Persicobacter]|uniref:RNA polymerase sigma-70 region 2 domain-containing protein n=1 Tax=Persicobacter diffluens TaxID=981 RepID=A0AAN4VXT3_9BACT|nr:sigma-70 family RNA polymerase sigma factor [Persicobacter sp. CCB-QB2]GJM60765.1 hypothetical protein PEDI_13170 [Persicobacter diffluens]